MFWKVLGLVILTVQRKTPAEIEEIYNQPMQKNNNELNSGKQQQAL